jgi:small GTP-binding protein
MKSLAGLIIDSVGYDFHEVTGDAQVELKQYEQWKFAIAEIIRSLRAVDRDDGNLSSGCVSLLARLAEDKFNLLVVGRFSRGKSTLMNAILGDDLLPTGIVPLTSVITTVRYGTRKQVILNFQNQGLRQEIPLSRLSEYVTQKGNPGNAKKLSFAEIELPVEILRRGLFFVDTPGLGSPILENTLTTEKFLPEADAFILVTSFESPLTEDEDRILRRIRNANRKIFIVVNKLDTVTSQERAEAIHFIQELLNSYSFREPPLVFSVSARQALDAKLSGEKERLQESELPILEEELRRFLMEERATAFLLNMYERTLRLLSEKLTAEQGQQNTETLSVLMKRLSALRDSIFGSADDATDSLTEVEENNIIDFPSLHFDKSTACLVCGSILKAVTDFLSHYQYALTIDPEVQREHARRGGFCPLHTWQYEAIASPYGVCAAYPPLTHRIARELQRFAADSFSYVVLHDAIESLLPTKTSCPACEERRVIERREVAEMANRVREWKDKRSDRVPVSCLHHLALVVQSLGDEELARKLVISQARLLERTAEDLQRYAIKFEGLRRFLASAEERQAYTVAMILLAGHRNVTNPWMVESTV